MKALVFVFTFISVTVFSQSSATVTVKIPETWHYTGTVNARYPIEMNIVFNTKVGTGYYRYYSQKTWLQLTEIPGANGNNLMLQETSNGVVSGTFEGTLEGGKYSGTWISADKKKSFPFAVTTDNQTKQFTFTVSSTTSDEGKTSVKTITVNNAHRLFVQQIAVDADNVWMSPVPDALSLEDFNFDGVPDLSLALSDGMRNTPHQFWIFDTTTGQFVENKELENIGDFVVSMQSKELISDTADGCCTYETAKYIFSNGHYYKVYSELNESGKKTIRKWKVEGNGTVEIKNDK